jgi:transcriptional regulator with XRE-family HTH domain
MRRLMLGMSQTTLAQGLDLTFKQIQKYEKGVNRVGASRLQQIAHILRVPVEFFFEGAPGVQGAKADVPDTPSLTHVSEFLATSDGLTLVAGFVKIRSAKLRRSIVELVSYLAQSQDK